MATLGRHLSAAAESVPTKGYHAATVATSPRIGSQGSLYTSRARRICSPVFKKRADRDVPRSRDRRANWVGEKLPGDFGS